MAPWLHEFKYDPINPLLSSGNEQVIYFAKRDLLDLPVGSIESLWELKTPLQILRKQQAGGFWKYPGKTVWYTTDYDQLETYRQLGFLIQMFGFDKSHPAVQKAAEYFFSKQSEQGDFRGIYAEQYSPNYTAAITELLVLAGYDRDQRVRSVFDWLLAVRQDDGGWALPLRTKGHNLEVILNNPTIEPDTSKPFSHLVTGIVLRAFASHPEYCKSKEAKDAGSLLATRFFQKDAYPDLGKASAWESFTYPFWNTSLLSSVDTLTMLGFRSDDTRIRQATEWLLDKQRPDGLFELRTNHDRYHDQLLWLDIAMCRIIKRQTTKSLAA